MTITTKRTAGSLTDPKTGRSVPAEQLTTTNHLGDVVDTRVIVTTPAPFFKPNSEPSNGNQKEPKH